MNFMKSVTSLTKAIAPAVHVIHSCSVDAVVGSLAVQGHLIPLLLRRDRAQTHVGQAGQGSSSKSSNSVDAQRMDRFLIKDLEQTKKVLWWTLISFSCCCFPGKVIRIQIS